MAPPKFELCDDGRRRVRVTVAMDVGYDQLHIAAYMTPGITTRPDGLTRADVLRQLDEELRLGGQRCHEGEGSCTDASGIDDYDARVPIDNAAFSNARRVVARLWPELSDDPEALR